MDAEGRVVAFLILHENLDFCDDCLAQELAITPERLEAIVRTLRKSAPILRDQWTCRHCGRRATVTRAVPNATFALNRRSRTRRQQSA
jgi:hypothetical protein